MPQIGWFEILIVVILAILIIGPKDFPVMLKKMGAWIGSIKRYFNEIQKDVTDMKNTVEDEISVEKKYSNNNKDKKKMNDETKSQGSFVEHFTELRSRLVKSIVYLFIFFIICYFFAENIYRFLVEPYADAVRGDELNRRLIFTALHETFITYLKVAFFTSLFVTSPIILTQIWKFIAPGLYKNEKKALLPYLIANSNIISYGRFAGILFGNASGYKIFFLVLKPWLKLIVYPYNWKQR